MGGIYFSDHSYKWRKVFLWIRYFLSWGLREPLPSVFPFFVLFISQIHSRFHKVKRQGSVEPWMDFLIHSVIHTHQQWKSLKQSMVNTCFGIICDELRGCLSLSSGLKALKEEMEITTKSLTLARVLLSWPRKQFFSSFATFSLASLSRNSWKSKTYCSAVTFLSIVSLTTCSRSEQPEPGMKAWNVGSLTEVWIPFWAQLCGLPCPIPVETHTRKIMVNGLEFSNPGQ